MWCGVGTPRDVKVIYLASAETSLRLVPLHSPVIFSPLWVFTVDDGGHFTLSCLLSHPLLLISSWDDILWFSRLYGHSLSMTVATLLCPVPYHTPPLLLMSSWDDMQWLSRLYGCSPLMTVATLLCPVFDCTLCF